MPLTNPNPGPSTGGYLDPHVFHVQHFTDHVGGSGRRLYLSLPDDPLPVDLRQAPRIIFQVYTTVPLGLDSDDPTVMTPNLLELTRYMVDPVMMEDKTQCDPPMLEIYETVFSDTLACIEHQRAEIQYRKTRQGENGVPLISKFSHPVDEQQGCGLVLVVHSSLYQIDISRNPYRAGEGTDGPRWAWFDRRSPAAKQIDHQRDLGSDEETRLQDLSLEADQGRELMPYETMEIECQVQPQPPHSMRSALASEYLNSYLFLEEFPALAMALHEDEVGPDYNTMESTGIIESGVKAVFNVTERRDSICVSTSDLGAEEPTLRYIIYVTCCSRDGLPSLKSVAVKFAETLSGWLPASSTISLSFYASSTISTTLAAYRAQRAVQDFDIGVLTSTTALANKVFPDGTQAPKRIHPIHREQALPFNDPTTSLHEPYRTFVVIIDTVDFVDRPGVLFMVADGGQLKSDAAHEPGSRSPYIELQVWREAGMDEVARRLAMNSTQSI